jgi:WD40 repeat protein
MFLSLKSVLRLGLFALSLSAVLTCVVVSGGYVAEQVITPVRSEPVLSALGSIRTVMWAPDSHLLAVGAANGVRLYDADAPGTAPQRLRGESGRVTSLAVAPQGRSLAAGLENGDVLLWSPVEGHHLRMLEDHVFTVQHLVFNPDGTKLASGGGRMSARVAGCTSDDYQDTDVRIWDVATGELLANLDGLGEVQALAFDSRGDVVMAGTSEHCAGRDMMKGSILRWDVQTGARLSAWVVRTPIVFSRDGQAAVTNRFDTPGLQVLEPETGDRIWATTDASFFRDMQVDLGNNVVAATAGHYMGFCTGVQVWDATTGDELFAVPACNPIALDPRGRFLVTGRGEMETTDEGQQHVDNTVRFWSIPWGELIATLDGRDGWVSQIALSSDGVFMALVLEPDPYGVGLWEDATVEVWDIGLLIAETR